MEESNENIASLALASVEFSFNLYKSLTASTKNQDNIFLSPFCLHNILSMTYLGSDGQTRYQLKNLLKFDFLKEDALRNAYRNLTSNELNSPTRLANRMYLSRSVVILDSFRRTCENDFNADAVNADLGEDPEAEVAINNWVEEKTDNKIKRLIPLGSLKPPVFMVLVNAIYFKGNWDVKFDPERTTNGPFMITASEETRVDYMVRTGEYKYGFSQDHGCSIVELPYKNKEYSMIAVLPLQNEGLADLEEKLNSSLLATLIDSMRPMKVEVRFPKFSLTSSMKLVDNLTSLGISDAFVPGKANLSRIDGTTDLYITEVFHKAFVDVNEDGTEAAAAGGVSISQKMLPPCFSANHPFLFLIRDNSTNIILFMGRLVRPE